MKRGTVKRLTVFFMAITNCCCEIFRNLRLPLRVERAQRPNRLGSTTPVQLNLFRSCLMENLNWSPLPGREVLGVLFCGRNRIALGRFVVEQNSFVVGGDSAQLFDQLATGRLPSG
jgi:hypothetical protein